MPVKIEHRVGELQSVISFNSIFFLVFGVTRSSA
jgi:hypothetical protein